MFTPFSDVLTGQSIPSAQILKRRPSYRLRHRFAPGGLFGFPIATDNFPVGHLQGFELAGAVKSTTA